MRQSDNEPGGHRCSRTSTASSRSAWSATPRSTPRATRPRRPRRAPSGSSTSSTCCATSWRRSAPSDVRLTGYGARPRDHPGDRGQPAPTVGLPRACRHRAAVQRHRRQAGRAPRATTAARIRFPDAPDLVLSPEESPYLAEQGRRRHRHRQRHHAARRRRQGRRRHRHDRGAPPARRTPSIAARPDPHRLHPRRGDRPRRARRPAARPRAPTSPTPSTAASAARSSTRPSPPTRRWSTITGVSIHPGWAKDKLVNALHLAAKIVDTLPQATRTPETTDGRAGLHPPLRDARHRRRGRARASSCATSSATASPPTARCSPRSAPRSRPPSRARGSTCTITPQYRNMRYWLENDMRPVELALRGLPPVPASSPFSEPVRGGTDGSRLTELGVPRPNVFTGMQMVHGPLRMDQRPGHGRRRPRLPAPRRALGRRGAGYGSRRLSVTTRPGKRDSVRAGQATSVSALETLSA